MLRRRGRHQFTHRNFLSPRRNFLFTHRDTLFTRGNFPFTHGDGNFTHRNFASRHRNFVLPHRPSLSPHRRRFSPCGNFTSTHRNFISTHRPLMIPAGEKFEPAHVGLLQGSECRRVSLSRRSQTNAEATAEVKGADVKRRPLFLCMNGLESFLVGFTIVLQLSAGASWRWGSIE